MLNQKQFKNQIRLLSYLGSFVSLDEIYNNTLRSKINFSITFDDVSKTVLKATQFLESKEIPYALGPTVNSTNNGFGWRDKVYFIIKNYDSYRLYDYVKNILGDNLKLGEKDFSFYHFTKSNDFNSNYILNKVINPLFEKIYKIDKNLS